MVARRRVYHSQVVGPLKPVGWNCALNVPVREFNEESPCSLRAFGRTLAAFRCNGSAGAVRRLREARKGPTERGPEGPTFFKTHCSLGTAPTSGLATYGRQAAGATASTGGTALLREEPG